MRTACFGLLALGIAFSLRTPTANAVPVPKDLPADGLAITLVGPEGWVPPGAPIRVHVYVANGGREPITLLRPIDGCDVGWRIVSYEWRVTRDGQPAPKRRLGGRCGNVNPLTVQDFLTLNPGRDAAVPLGFLGSPTDYYDFSEPGTSRVELVSRFDPKNREKGGVRPGPDADATEALLRKAWVGEHVSQSLTFKVEKTQPALGAARMDVLKAEIRFEETREELKRVELLYVTWRRMNKAEVEEAHAKFKRATAELFDARAKYEKLAAQLGRGGQ